MPAPLPNPLRERLRQYIDKRLRVRAAALRLCILPATGVLWTQRKVKQVWH